MPVVFGAGEGKSPRISMLQQGKLRGKARWWTSNMRDFCSRPNHP